MPDPLYIDQIQFSDATYEIRDRHARELIEQIQILGGLPAGTADNDILLWDNSDQEWKPNALYTAKSVLEHVVGSDYIDTGIIPGNNDIKIEMDYKVNTINASGLGMDLLFLIGSDSSNAVNGVGFGIHNNKWNNLISGQDYGDSNITADTIEKNIIYQIIGNTISISGDLSITKTVNNLRNYNWYKSSIKLGFKDISAVCDYYIFKIYINNVLLFELEPMISNILGLYIVNNKVTNIKSLITNSQNWFIHN